MYFHEVSSLVLPKKTYVAATSVQLEFTPGSMRWIKFKSVAQYSASSGAIHISFSSYSMKRKNYLHTVYIEMILSALWRSIYTILKLYISVTSCVSTSIIVFNSCYRLQCLISYLWFQEYRVEAHGTNHHCVAPVQGNPREQCCKCAMKTLYYWSK